MFRKLRFILGFVCMLSMLAACSTTGTGTSVEGEGDLPVREKGDKLARTNVQLGIGYMQQGNYEFALSKLRKALEIDESLAEGHYAIAILYERLNKPQHARRHYARAVELDSHYSDAHNAYAVFLCRNKEYEEADQHFQEAIKNPLYRTPQQAQLNAGVCMLNSSLADRLPRSEKYFLAVLQRLPEQPQALLNMSKIAMEQGDHLRARAYLQRYLAVAKHTPESLWLGIQIEEKLGDKNALSSYKLLLKKTFPDSDEARKLLESGK